jgi:hypothetical protein
MPRTSRALSKTFPNRWRLASAAHIAMKPVACPVRRGPRHARSSARTGANLGPPPPSVFDAAPQRYWPDDLH